LLPRPIPPCDPGTDPSQTIPRIQSPRSLNQLKQKTLLALPRDGLLNFSLCLPPVQLLEAFEKQVGPLLAAVDANLHQSRTLAALRDTLLPKLLSGELRVPDAERAITSIA
ncbi:MAG: hypothetical protein ACKOKG_09560, partial [Verrucomicrobiota bacterium]